MAASEAITAFHKASQGSKPTVTREVTPESSSYGTVTPQSDSTPAAHHVNDQNGADTSAGPATDASDTSENLQPPCTDRNEASTIRTTEAGEVNDVESPQRVVSPVTSPPYWSHSNARPISTASVESVLAVGAIMLQDNECADEPDSANVVGRDRNRACWAKSVEVTDYIIVNGSATNLGAFVVWNIRVETLAGTFINIRKRYSEFDTFRRQLIHTFPNFEAAVPVLPPKSVVSKFRHSFLERRRSGLQYFLNCILLNPEFSGSPVLKDFLFS
ncbi:hypothetical protein VTK73DRAFT_7156 [Phialemonium thermophilum]|uniref:Endosomal/vacuolar adapter protein YPT35 n=1 Tax=Phialemonium thermophilum TaxID=223376 RepID=A0ABR3XUS4_9PEZI